MWRMDSCAISCAVGTPAHVMKWDILVSMSSITKKVVAPYDFRRSVYQGCLYSNHRKIKTFTP